MTNKEDLTEEEIELLNTADDRLAEMGIDRTTIIPALVRRSKIDREKIEELQRFRNDSLIQVRTTKRIGAAILSLLCAIGAVFAFVVPFFADKKTIDRARVVSTCLRVRECDQVKKRETILIDLDRKIKKLDRRVRANRRFIKRYRMLQKIKRSRKRRNNYPH